ncbi:MAG: NAD-dependent epimerase/dehydratase family protein [Bacteroidota bacterium]
MNSPLHTVLGASGSIAQATVDALLSRAFQVRAVSRMPALPNVQNHPADLLDPQQSMEAIAGSDYVYLCVGLPYKSSVWARDWEILMHNVIEACAATDARLIYLDNIYMYGPTPLQVPFDETHPQQPPSVKGKARKRTTDMLLKAFREAKVQGVIGRAADIYGPKAVNSTFYISFLERMLQGKAPQALFPLETPHRYTCTTDLGEALVQLALAEDTHGEVWHLPVGPLTNIGEMLQIMNRQLGTNFKASIMPPFLRTLLSFFIPALREMKEMMYQFEQPYDFSDAKFRARFPDFKVSTYEEGIAGMIQSFREAGSSS